MHRRTPARSRDRRRPIATLARAGPSQLVVSARPKRSSGHPVSHAPAVRRLGALPEWNLADLYAGLDDPQVKRDLDRGAAESLAFEQAYKGKLAALAEEPAAGAALAEAVKRYEALDDL